MKNANHNIVEHMVMYSNVFEYLFYNNVRPRKAANSHI